MDPNIPTQEINTTSPNQTPSAFMSKAGDKIRGALAALNSKKKIIATIFGLVLLTSSVGIGIYLTQKSQQTKVGATGVSLTLSTTNATPKVGDTFVVAVSMNTQGASVSGADLKIKYDSTLVDATAITAGDFLPTVFVPGKITAGAATITVGCLVNTTGAYPKNGTGLLTQITFKAKAAGNPNITFDPASAVAAVGQSTNTVGTLTPVQVTITGPTSPATITPSPTPTPSKTPTPTPSPSKTPSPTPSPTPTPSKTPTPTPTPSAPPTATPFCTVRPACLDASPPCVVPVPTDGWCATPTPTSGNSPGDVNGDGVVNILDIGAVVDSYGKVPPPNPKADLNGDGAVNIIDIGIVVDHYQH